MQKKMEGGQKIFCFVERKILSDLHFFVLREKLSCLEIFCLGERKFVGCRNFVRVELFGNFCLCERKIFGG